jgi:hypothetical protein
MHCHSVTATQTAGLKAHLTLTNVSVCSLVSVRAVRSGNCVDYSAHGGSGIPNLNPPAQQQPAPTSSTQQTTPPSTQQQQQPQQSAPAPPQQSMQQQSQPQQPNPPKLSKSTPPPLPPSSGTPTPAPAPAPTPAPAPPIEINKAVVCSLPLGSDVPNESVQHFRLRRALLW